MGIQVYAQEFAGTGDDKMNCAYKIGVSEIFYNVTKE